MKAQHSQAQTRMTPTDPISARISINYDALSAMVIENEQTVPTKADQGTR